MIPLAMVGGTLLTSLGQGAINYGTAALTARMNYIYAKKLAEEEWSRNYQMWQEMNKYNAPAAQMSRLAEAGLNPHLVYGSGGASVTAASPPAYRAGNVSFDMLPPNLLLYQTLRSGYLQNKLVSEQIRQQKAVARQAEIAAEIAEETKESAINRIVEDSKTSTYTRMQQELEALIAHEISEKGYFDQLVKQRLNETELTKYQVESAKQNLRQQFLNIVKTEIETELLKLNKSINEIDERIYRETGVRPGDSVYMRYLGRALSELGVNISDILKKVAKWFLD
jgi:hypothetical protein